MKRIKQLIVELENEIEKQGTYADIVIYIRKKKDTWYYSIKNEEKNPYS